jgi:hypothetical protein
MIPHVTWLDSGDARNAGAGVCSAARLVRLRRGFSPKPLSFSEVPSDTYSGVHPGPCAMECSRIPRGAVSCARALVEPSTGNLLDASLMSLGHVLQPRTNALLMIVEPSQPRHGVPAPSACRTRRSRRRIRSGLWARPSPLAR